MLQIFKSMIRKDGHLFLDVLREYFAYISPSKSDSTKEKYRYFYETIQKHFTEIGHPDILLSEVRVKTMETFRIWMHERKTVTREHVSRHIEHCQAAIDYAILMEYTTSNPISPIKKQRDKVKDPVSLTKYEVKRLMDANFTNPTWQLIADLFLFQCFTGLSYMDLWMFEIEKDGIVLEGQNKTIYFITSKSGRGKNSKPYSVQFNALAMRIYEKYNGSFPIVTDQCYNRLIKKIGFALNLSNYNELSSHNGRKTYSTLRYNMGMSLEGLSDEMGSTPDVLRTHYITTSRERIKRDIQQMGSGSLISFAVN